MQQQPSGSRRAHALPVMQRSYSCASCQAASGSDEKGSRVRSSGDCQLRLVSPPPPPALSAGATTPGLERRATGITRRPAANCAHPSCNAAPAAQAGSATIPRLTPCSSRRPTSHPPLLAHLLRMRAGRVTMCTCAAVWQAVRGASPVIMTSWWRDSRSMRSAGSESSFSGERKTAKPAGGQGSAGRCGRDQGGEGTSPARQACGEGLPGPRASASQGH